MSVTRTIDYKGIPTMQAKKAFQVFESFFSNEKIELVIEIGTAYGGLSKFLHDQSQIFGFKFITYDRYKDRLFDKIPNPEFEFRNIDCFSENGKQEIIEALLSKKTLLLCDGGNKKNEFNLFSEYIQHGSYIMAHDYSPDREYFEKEVRGKIWNWFEISDEDVSESLINYLEKSNYYDEFLEVVWLSCVKK